MGLCVGHGVRYLQKINFSKRKKNEKKKKKGVFHTDGIKLELKHVFQYPENL